MTRRDSPHSWTSVRLPERDLGEVILDFAAPLFAKLGPTPPPDTDQRSRAQHLQRVWRARNPDRSPFHGADWRRSQAGLRNGPCGSVGCAHLENSSIAAAATRQCWPRRDLDGLGLSYLRQLDGSAPLQGRGSSQRLLRARTRTVQGRRRSRWLRRAASAVQGCRCSRWLLRPRVLLLARRGA